MKRVLLEAREDEYGNLGLVVQGTKRTMDMSAANEGLLIAHDLIEHVNGIGNIGSIDDELEAIGSGWYTRGFYGDLRRDGRGSMHTVEEHFASDVSRMAITYMYGVDFKTKVPRTNNHDHDCAFDEIIAIARKQARDELDGEVLTVDKRRRLSRYYESALHYMRKGFMKQNKRFGSNAKANTVFWNIADAVEPFCKPEFEGEEFVLHYDFNRAYCEHNYEEENYG